MAGTPGRSLNWHDMTTAEAARWIERDPVALLPIAAVEQHGPHLPLSTDCVIAEGIVASALAGIDVDTPVSLLPTQAVGASEEHTTFAGTLSLSATTLERVLFDLGASLAASGLRRLVVFSAHGGNRAAVDTAALRLRRAFGMLVVKTHYGRFPRPEGVDLPPSEWTHGLHGGAVETAMMMHLAPEAVRADELRAFDSLGVQLENDLTWLGPEGVAPFAWSADDLSPHGVVGDARLADPEIGQQLVVHYGACLADVLRDAHRFPIERLGDPTVGEG